MRAMTESKPMSGNIIIRPGIAGDVAALTEIYNYFVVNTHFTFDVEPWSAEVRLGDWFSQFDEHGRYRLMVALDECEGEIMGYASSGRFKKKRAYETSVEATVYLKPGVQGRGIGRLLYESLFAELKSEDVHRAYAGVAQPNEVSLRFHQRMGFHEVGTYREVGRKFGKYWDVTWLERAIGS